MYRYDYILRLIEQLSRALIALRNHILNREVASTEVRAELEAMARQAGIDLAVARRVTEVTRKLAQPAADALFAAVRPILERSPMMKGARVTLRYGRPGDDVPESHVTIT